MSIGNIVLLPATVAGMGRTAECEVMARKQTVITKGKLSRFDCTYSDCSIIGAPGDFPDGEYTVRFDGATLNATRYHGYWLPRGQAKRDPESLFMAG